MRRLCAVGCVLLFLAVAAHAGPVGYTLDVTAIYIFGSPSGTFKYTVGPTGSPDTSFLIFTNNGASTFSGTFQLSATGWTTQSITGTLAPGEQAWLSLTNESSNYGGFNGGSPQLGMLFDFSGTISLGLASEAASGNVYDSQIHSGVFATNPYGVTLDNYVMQGGDPYGRDTGDSFEVAQAAGQYQFYEAPAPPPSTVPEPASLFLTGSGLLGCAGFLRRRIFR